MLFENITIVGVGLIGASIGKTVKSRGLARNVVGVGRSIESLRKAIEVKAIDCFETSIHLGVKNADLVIVCTPVNLIAAQVIQAAYSCPPGCLLTDAGSTKAKIVAEIEEAAFARDVQFVGSHPIAGSAQRGPEAAVDGLFDNKTTVVTPTKHSTEAGVLRIEAFWESLGSKVVRLDADTHDSMLGWSSHLPHIVASILAYVLPENARPYTGTGFRDATRIASGDPGIWMPIIEHNQDAILHCLEEMQLEIRSFKHLLSLNDFTAVRQLLEEGKRGRDALGS